ncbi:MAG: AAA family ATPase [Gemmatimonadetes bacterium]|nr:AAA family ATPase [Gemmatimonadota bacterium]
MENSSIGGDRSWCRGLRGLGYFRGSSVLVSGSAGTGKTSLAGYFVDAACRRGESSLYFAFEESAAQIMRNLRSIGLDLDPSLQKRLLQVHAARPTTSGLEGHLSAMHRLIEEKKPRVVVVDPISNLISVGTSIEVKAILARLERSVPCRRRCSIRSWWKRAPCRSSAAGWQRSPSTWW